jgi:hypothetical protein
VWPTLRIQIHSRRNYYFKERTSCKRIHINYAYPVRHMFSEKLKLLCPPSLLFVEGVNIWSTASYRVSSTTLHLGDTTVKICALLAVKKQKCDDRRTSSGGHNHPLTNQLLTHNFQKPILPPPSWLFTWGEYFRWRENSARMFHKDYMNRSQRLNAMKPSRTVTVLYRYSWSHVKISLWSYLIHFPYT